MLKIILLYFTTVELFMQYKFIYLTF